MSDNAKLAREWVANKSGVTMTPGKVDSLTALLDRVQEETVFRVMRDQGAEWECVVREVGAGAAMGVDGVACCDEILKRMGRT